MKTATLHDSLDQVLGPLQKTMSAEFQALLANYQVDGRFQKQLDRLARKNTEGKLTALERKQYRHHLSALKVMTILRAQARRQLADRE